MVSYHEPVGPISVQCSVTGDAEVKTSASLDLHDDLAMPLALTT